MKNRIFNILLTLCMVLTLLPTTVSAGSASSVTVGDAVLNSENPYLVNNAAASAGTLGEEQCTAHFDADTGTLTLQDAAITSSTGNTIFTTTSDLTVVLVGNNTVTSTSSQNDAAFNTISGGNLKFKGDGSLNTSGKYGGIYAFDDIIIEGGTITATGEKAGISCHSGKLIISGGNVTGTATTSGGYGIGQDWGGTLNLAVEGNATVTAIGENGANATGGVKTNTTHNVMAGDDEASAELVGTPDNTTWKKPYVKLTPGNSISGTITSDQSSAIEDATVQIQKDQEDFGAATTTDADGKYTTQTVPNGNYTIKVSKTGYDDATITEVNVSDSPVTGKDQSLTEVVVSDVAEIGTQKYTILADAFQAAEDGDTVKLLTNVHSPETIYVSGDSEKTIILDLNGCALSGKYVLVLSSNITLKVTDSGNDGKITGSAYAITVYSGSNLVLEKGTIETTDSGAAAVSMPTMSSSSKTTATFKMTGGTLKGAPGSALSLDNGASATLTDGTLSATGSTNGTIYVNCYQDPEPHGSADLNIGSDVTVTAGDEQGTAVYVLYGSLNGVIDPSAAVTGKLPDLDTTTPVLTADDGKVTLAPQTTEAGYKYYYKSTSATDEANKPKTYQKYVDGYTEYSDATDISGTNGTAMYVQVIKVNEAGGIVGWGEASATPIGEISNKITTGLLFTNETVTQDCTKGIQHTAHTHADGKPCWAWNADTDTLTLSGINIEANVKNASGSRAGAIYGEQTINVDLTEDTVNVVTGSGDSNNWNCGIYLSEGDLNIGGKGTLNVTGGTGFTSHGISVNSGSLNISDGIVSSTGRTASGISGIFSREGISITGGTIHAIAKDTSPNPDSVRGIETKGEITLSGGTVTAEAVKGGVPFNKEPLLENGMEHTVGTGEWNNTDGTACTYGAHIITFNANGGSVAPATATTNADGKLATLPTPTRSGNYRFNGWFTAQNGGTKVTTDTVFTANSTIYAHWTYTGGSGSGSGSDSSPYDYYGIEISKKGNGTISPNYGQNNTITIREGRNQTFTFTPEEGYVISDVLVDDKSIGAETSYTFNDVTKDHTLEVIFAVNDSHNKPQTDVDFEVSDSHDKPQTGVDFEDVTENDWFYDSVVNAVENDWFTGTSYTTFSPYLATTRGMIATVLWRMENEPKTTEISIFEDVTSDSWYFSGILWAEENGIVDGYDNGSFGPQDNITREQLATILYRYAQFKGFDTSKTSTLTAFADATTISEYAKVPMAWAVENNFISGRGDGILDPKTGATRGEAATIFTRFDQTFS